MFVIYDVSLAYWSVKECHKGKTIHIPRKRVSKTRKTRKTESF